MIMRFAFQGVQAGSELQNKDTSCIDFVGSSGVLSGKILNHQPPFIEGWI